MSDHKDSIDAGEYEVLQFAYTEWTKINKTIAFFAFAIIGFSVAAQANLNAATNLTDSEKNLVREAFVAFLSSGLAAGLNMCIAYIWMDAIRRNHKTSLIGKTVIGNYPKWCLKLGFFGWVLSIFSILAIIYGIFLLKDIAMKYLGIA